MKNSHRLEVLKKLLKKKKKSILQPSPAKDSKLSSYWEETQIFLLLLSNLSGKSFRIRKCSPKIDKFKFELQEIAVRIFQLLSSFKFYLLLFLLGLVYFCVFEFCLID